MRTIVLSCLLLAASALPAHASVIAVFDNSTYVDTTGVSPVPSSDALQALLSSQSNTVHTFTGLTDGDFTTALNGADLILFPQLLNFGVLATDLSASAKTVLADYVAGGGGLIAIGDSATRLLNAIFYPTCDFATVKCFASTGGGGDSFQTGEATGTPFAADPGTLTVSAGNAINHFAFNPAGAENLYKDASGGTTVLTAPFGSGEFGFLAWSFGNAAPAGNLDGGWDDVLDTTVSVVARPAAVPAPGSSSLLGLALLALGGITMFKRGSSGSIHS